MRDDEDDTGSDPPDTVPIKTWEVLKSIVLQLDTGRQNTTSELETELENKLDRTDGEVIRLAIGEATTPFPLGWMLSPSTEKALNQQVSDLVEGAAFRTVGKRLAGEGFRELTDNQPREAGAADDD